MAGLKFSQKKNLAGANSPGLKHINCCVHSRMDEIKRHVAAVRVETGSPLA